MKGVWFSDLVQGGDEVEELEEDVDDGGDENGFNQTEALNGTTHRRPQGFLEDFLHR